MENIVINFKDFSTKSLQLQKNAKTNYFFLLFVLAHDIPLHFIPNEMFIQTSVILVNAVSKISTRLHGTPSQKTVIFILAHENLKSHPAFTIIHMYMYQSIVFFLRSVG
jgi:hypothetical protein